MVAHPAVDPTMSSSRAVALGLVLLLAAPAFLLAVGVLAPPVRAASTSPVTGSVTGPTIVSTSTSTKYEVFGFGGPAVAPNGTVVGKLSYFSSLAGPNLTGVSFSPARGNFTSNKSLPATLTVANASETLTISVMVSSVESGKNQSINFTYAVNVVRPYVVSATIVNTSSFAVSGFTVLVTLDGSVIGNVSVPSIAAGGKYQLSFDYATLGLSSGYHTFAISLAREHGLVTFANGLSTYSETVYISGPAPSYALWYVAGIVAFFGAVFIIVSRVAARRRGQARR